MTRTSLSQLRWCGCKIIKGLSYLGRINLIKEHMETVREMAAIVALIMGGLWAYYQFEALRSEDKAALEVKKLQQETDRQPVIEVIVTAKTSHSAGVGDLIEIEAVVKNNGRLREFIDLSQQPFRIYPVEFKDKEYLPTATGAWEKTNINFPKITTTTNLLPGEKQRFRLLYHAPAPRLYYIEFAVALSEKSKEQWKNIRNLTKDSTLEWFDGVYIEVKPSEK